jgi:hypothetical protein
MLPSSKVISMKLDTSHLSIPRAGKLRTCKICIGELWQHLGLPEHPICLLINLLRNYLLEARAGTTMPTMPAIKAYQTANTEMLS